jgi:predicted RNase H-like HicB family nuclease
VRLKAVLERSEEGGYTAFVPALPGCIREGNTRAQARANSKEPMGLSLEPGSDDSGVQECGEKRTGRPRGSEAQPMVHSLPPAESGGDA